MGEKIYLLCWTTEAMSNPSYMVEKVFRSKEKAERYKEKIPPPYGNYDGWWIEEFDVED